MAHVTGATDIFRCEKCDEYFLELKSLSAHEKKECAVRLITIIREETESEVIPSEIFTSKSEEKSKTCSFCDKSFKKKSDLAIHVRTHTGEKPFSCTLCHKSFAQKSNLKKHLKTHKVWPTMPPSNARNPSIFISSDRYESGEHIKITLNNSFQCHFCEESFDSHPAFRSHLLSHKNLKKFKCEKSDCTEIFEDVESLLVHQTTHEPEHITLNEDFVCSTAVETTGFRCHMCHKTFKTQTGLDNHLQTDDHAHPCLLCSQVFKSERYFLRHLANHSSERPKFQCNVCQKSFKSEWYLKTHNRIHTGALPFKCNECDAAFNRKDKLKRHQLKHDDSNKVYECPFVVQFGCSAKFARYDNFKKHMEIHQKSVFHRCKECDMEFNTSSLLRKHISYNHPKEAVLKCFECDKYFKLEKLRQNHMDKDHGIRFEVKEDGSLVRETQIEQQHLDDVTNIVIYVPLTDSLNIGQVQSVEGIN